MIANYQPSRQKLVVQYRLEFDTDNSGGFSFPCDENGIVVSDLNKDAKENLKHCLAHPEEFVAYNKVRRHEYSYTEPAKGTCSCGAEIDLSPTYMGACECSNCGKWYNAWGQELLPPDRWGEEW